MELKEGDDKKSQKKPLSEEEKMNSEEKSKRNWRIGKVVASLIVAWAVFLFLVKRPPIADTTMLIMIWTSFGIVMLTLFPQIIESIKSINFKGFAIELRDSVADSINKDNIPFYEIPDFEVASKGSFHYLSGMIKNARSNPEDRILLITNVKNGYYVSISMLFIYLYFLEYYSSTIILFVEKNDNNVDIEKSSIIGAMYGKDAMQILMRRFPKFNNILSCADAELSVGFDSTGSFIDGVPTVQYLEELNGCIDTLDEGKLNREKVKSIFRKKLFTTIIDSDNKDSETSLIFKALSQGVELLICVERDRYSHIVPMESVTTSISKDMLQKSLNATKK